MHPSEDFRADRALPAGSADLVGDLGLASLFSAMAGGDKFVLAVAKAAVLSPLAQPEEVLYRQGALADCTAHPGYAQELYSLATDALEAHQKVTFWSLNITSESLRYYSVQSLELFLGLPRPLAPSGRNPRPGDGFPRLRQAVLDAAERTGRRVREGPQ